MRTAAGDIPCGALVLAPGHSARDTFFMLADAGFALQAKPFSVGFRAEPLQADIERGLYHRAAGHPALPRAEYQLSQHVGARCVYTVSYTHLPLNEAKRKRRIRRVEQMPHT